MAAEVVDVLLRAHADVSEVSGSFRTLQKQLEGLSLPKGVSENLEKSFTKLTPLIKDYQKQLNKGFSTQKDLKNFEILRQKIDDIFGEIETEIDQVNSKEVRLKVDIQALDNLKKQLAESKANIEKYSNEIFKIDHPKEDVKHSMQSLQNALNVTFKTGKLRFPALSGIGDELKKAFNVKDYAGFNNVIDSLKNKILSLSETGRRDIARSLGLKEAEKDIKSVDKALITFLNNMSLNKNAVKGLNKATEEAKNLEKAIKDVETQSVTNGIKGIESAAGGLGSVRQQFKAIGDEAIEAGKGSVRMAEEFKQLQQSTQYFFGLRNMINLLKRGVREAVDVVKELDAAMTETAVVTDYSVGDMWQKLPEYTANANALGATVKDMYEATTLYYQQGLRTESAMGIANETMKMARIGGLEATDATDKMTAALRGFNMEINETSAQRVNDVYSNLAAKTASNTEELGTAMQRTASIAHSAGMSFEGTAAFLAQAIETTREPAENLGTAMKTIVARFTELKKNPLEITEVDGEEVSYNKVDTALQSIGVSLKDANGQFRDLDKVFLDISKRWDSLTQTQQRYIATTAAGSRQQSRFIAMMSNYERTMQLMDFANNSAGASNEQFGKTMESLEAKLNKLRNAWNEFLMGIMNDKWTKRLVDAGTGILNLVNKIIDKLSFNGELGLVKSFLSMATAFTALKAGGNIINKLIGGLGGLVDPTSSFGKGFWGAGKTTPEGTPITGVAGKITTPIIAKLNELIAVTKGNKEGQIKTTSTIDQYKATNQALRKINGMDMGTIGALFGGLSDEHAYTAYKNAPGTADAMKQAALGWFGSKKMSADAQRTGQQLMNAIFKGMSKKEISIKDGMKLMGQPEKWGQYFGTDVAQNFSNSFSKELTQQAVDKTWADLGMKLATPDTRKDYLSDKDLRQKFIDAFKINRQSLMGGLDSTSVSSTNFQQLANSVGALGSKFSAAGMSLQMFGTQLGQLSPALQGVGNLLTKIGMAANTFGMGISGIGTIVTKLGGRVAAGQAAVKYGSAAMAKAVASGAVAAESTVAATGTGAASAFISGFTGGMSAGPIAAIIIGVLTAGLMIAKGIADKKAREAGQEVRDNFEKGFTETNKKIDSLEGYKDRFDELSKGVDQFGHNINLTDEEFDEYLSISRELQELSPSLIAGYNAEGQAILRKGAALDEVINKLKEERDTSLSDYIDNGSIEKLINEYKTSDTYSKHHKQEDHVSYYSGTVTPGAGAFDTEKTGISKAVKQAGLEWSEFSQILNELGIGSAESIDQLTNRQLSLISDHYGDILNKIREVNPQIETEAEDGLREAFANTNNAIEDVLSEGTPITEALRQWMGQEHLDAVGLNLGEEFVGGFNSGLEGLMLEGLTNNWKPEEYKQQLKEYSDEWKNLAGPTSDYTRILKEADEIQEDYLDHIGEEGAIEDYKENIEDSAQKLEDLANSTDTATEAGQIFVEQCMQQANALRNYATEGAMSLSEALNVLSGKFAEARGAKERFDKATEGGDYYTAAEGFRSIAETVLDDKNVAGDGSLTGWIGAEQLLGQNFVDNHSWDQIVSHLKTVNRLFDDGIEGVYNFNDMLVQAVNEGKDLSGLGEVVDGAFHFDFDNVDNLKQYADLLGISEDVLAGMIDKSRQFAAFNVGNNKQIRQALEQSEQAMVGQTYGKNGKSNLYMSEAAFRTEAYAQGIRGDDYTKTKSDLTKEQNVQFLTVDSLTTKSKDGLGIDKVLKDVGLDGADKTLNNTVAALTKMGFDLEDQKRILTTDGLKLADGDATADAIEQAYQEQEFASENPTVAGIANNTGVIATAATALLAKMGILTDQAKKDIETSTSKDTVDGIKKSLTPDGGFKDASSREEARAGVESKIADYNATIANLESSGNEALQPYIDKLIGARDDLQLALDTEADSWKTKLTEASELVKGIGTKSEQEFLQSKAVDIENIVSQEDITKAATALRQLEEEGNLSHSTMAQLAADFLQLRQNNLSQLDSSQIDNLCTKLGLTKDEATELLDVLQVPFSLEGRLSGEDLTAYINEVDGLTTTERTILLNADLSGEEKVSAFIDEINAEFGDGTEKTKSIILQAETKMAGGDQTGAEKLLADAGFNENQVKEITQQLSITVNGTVANKEEVQQALTSQLNDMDLSAEVKAKVSAKLDIQNQKSNLNQTGTISYKSKVDQGAVNQAKNAAAKGADMPIKAVDKASSTIQSIRNKAGKSVSFNVSPNFTGTWTKILTIKTSKVPGNARGRGFSIPAHQTLSFGAAAEGMNIPKKKRVNSSQVTALVGEEGYEVGYIPSEQRSVIFGVNGPEMTSFPSDTVIYPHNQSKEILRRGKGKHQTAGSFVSGTLPSRFSGGGSFSKSKQKNSKGSGSSSSSSKSSSSSNSNPNESHFSIEEVIRFDYDKTLETLASKIKKTTDQIENNLNKIGITAKDVSGIIQDQMKNLEATKKFNERLIASYQKDLDALDKNKYMMTVSYNTGGGKNKDSKEYTFDAQWYVYQGADGQYQINENAIKKLGNKELEEAVFKAVEGVLNSLASGLLKAQDAAYEAQKQIDDLNKKLVDAFYMWKNELTEIYNLSQQISMQSAMQDRFSSQTALELARLSAGFGDTAQSIAIMTQANTRNNQSLVEQIKRQQSLIDAREREINAFATGTDEIARLMAFKNMGIGSGENQFATQAVKDEAIAEAEQKLRIVELARQYMVGGAPVKNADGTITYEIDWEKFEQDAVGMNSETAKAIKEFFDQLESANVDYNNSIKESAELLKSTYDKLKEYQNYLVDFENTLLHQLEEQAKEEIDNVKKSSESISNALKDLFDEVKRRLNERRQQEDNAKTERDIAQKQQRLAALRADTSGGHQVEIAQLQKEIADSQQSYGRTLEDQLLERLQQQGDEAAAQRTRQIELAEYQATLQEESNKEQLALWLRNPANYKKEIKELWMEAQDYDSKGLLGQAQTENTFESSFAELVQAAIESESETEENKLAKALGATTIVNSIDSIGDTISTQQTDDKNFHDEVVNAFGEIFKVFSDQKTALSKVTDLNVQSGPKKTDNAKVNKLVSGLEPDSAPDSTKTTDGFIDKKLVEKWKKGNITKKQALQAGADKDIVETVYKTPQETTPPPAPEPTPKATSTTSTNTPKGPSRISEVSRDLKYGHKGNDVKLLQQALNALKYRGSNGSALAVDGDFGPNTLYAVKRFQSNSSGVKVDGVVGPATKKAFKKKGYKTGGLADYTGPAWLDGTPSKPELVLNATDTKNFLALRDVLSSAMKSTSTVSNSYGGDVMYDINIHVDKIEKDYDVDRVVDKVKKEITKGAGYRNVTQVRNFR